MGDSKVEVKWNAKGDSERVRRRFASPFSTSFASPFTTFASPFKPPSHFLAMRSKPTVKSPNFHIKTYDKGKNMDKNSCSI